MTVTYGQFATQFGLKAGPKRIAWTHSNAVAIVAWCVAEGSPAQCNPLDDTQPMPGSWPLKGNSAGVQNYISLDEAMDAYLRTLSVNDFGYPAINEQLAKGDCACLVTEAIANSQWGTWYHNPKAAEQTVIQVNGNFSLYANRAIPGT